MKYLKVIMIMPAASSLILLLFSREAYAYLDPGSGSYMLQLIIGGF